MKKAQIIAMLLAIILIISILPISMAAQDQMYSHETYPEIVVDQQQPIGVTNADYQREPITSNKYYTYHSAPVTYSSIPSGVHETIESAAAELRDGMVARQPEIVINLLDNGDYDGSFCQEIFDCALNHTGNPTEGDFLRWQYGSCSWSYCYLINQEGVEWAEIIYRPSYYTTAPQEAELDTAINTLLDELDLWEASDYDKISGVYEWICQNVTYDYDNLEDDSYQLKFTAYAALVDRTAVCQGYSTLLYRLLLELGIDNRVISGTGNGGAHSWNIVQLDGLYYNMDSTWDASCRQAGLDYSYFLLFDADFEDHLRDEEYATDSFYQEYPMQGAEYNPDCQAHQYESVVTAPTCTEKGFTTHTCVLCGSSYQDNWVPAGHNFQNGVCQLCGLQLIASGACGDNLTWTLSTDGMLTISGTGDMWDFHDDSTASFTDRPWEDFSDKIVTIMFGNDVVSIGKGAFRDCINLTSLIFGDGLDLIGNWAFYRCTSLATFDLPGTLRTIQAESFAYCDQLQSVVIPASIGFLDAHCFSNCDNLTYVEIKSNPNLPSFTIGNGAFAMCDNLKEIIVEDGHIALRSYDGVLFVGDTVLQYPLGKKDSTWSVPNGTDSIFADAFKHSLYLEEIHIPENVTEIDGSAFYACNALKKVTLSEGLEAIRTSAFGNCNALQEINLPSTLTYIGQWAFDGCTNLTALTIPASVTSIEGSPYAAIPRHVNVTIDAENTSFQIIDGIMYDKPVTKIVQVFVTVAQKVNILEGITEIPQYTFTSLDQIQEITIPDSVTTIGSFAFFGCTSLRSITIPDSVTSIDDHAFYRCYNLTSISIPDGVTSIGGGVFSECTSLTSITIPNSVTSIGDNAFYACNSLTSITIPDSVTSIGDSAFCWCWPWHVLYKGTEDQWNAISIAANNAPLENATRHYNCSGDEIIDLVNKVCTICVANCTHQWDDGQIIQKPTCIENGDAVYTCTLCGTTETGIVTAPGHDWSAAT